MLGFKKVAVTGGIASGKTTVCRLFKELGAAVISADDIVHQLLSPDTNLGQKVIALLGHDIVVGGVLSREAIARKVFRDSHLLERLEQLVHPEVQRTIEEGYQKLIEKKPQAPLFVAEVPLLFESGQETFYDYVILVTAEDRQAKRRFIQDGRYGADEYERRKGRLMPEELKLKKSHFHIRNDGTIQELSHLVTKLFNSLTSR